MYGLKNIKTAVSPTSLPPLSIYAENFVLLFSLVNPIHLLPRVCLLSSFVGSVNKNSDSHFTSIRVFSNESAPCIMSPKYLELQLQHQSFQ